MFEQGRAAATSPGTFPALQASGKRLGFLGEKLCLWALPQLCTARVPPRSQPVHALPLGGHSVTTQGRGGFPEGVDPEQGGCALGKDCSYSCLHAAGLEGVLGSTTPHPRAQGTGSQPWRLFGLPWWPILPPSCSHPAAPADLIPTRLLLVLPGVLGVAKCHLSVPFFLVCPL